MKNLKLTFLALSTLIFANVSYAAVPAAASDAVSELVTDAAAFIASFWPLAIAVVVGLLWFKLFNKATSKAT